MVLEIKRPLYKDINGFNVYIQATQTQNSTNLSVFYCYVTIKLLGAYIVSTAFPSSDLSIIKCKWEGDGVSRIFP